MRDKIDIELHGFDSDLIPVLTITRELSGRRNRHLRRAGVGSVEHVGSQRDVVDGEAHAAPLYPVSRGEIWGFAGGYEYRVEQLVDGLEHEVFIDAREGHEVVPFVDGIEVVSWSVDEGDDLPDQEDSGDDSSSAPGELPVQEEQPAPGDDASNPAPSDDQASSEADAAVVPADDDAENIAAADAADADNQQAPAADDSDGDSKSDKDYQGSIPHFVEHILEVSDNELLRLSEEDHRKGIRERALEEIDSRTATSGDPED